VPVRVAEWMMTIFGLWALLTPLFIWISWSAQIFAFALFTGIAAILLAGIFGIAVAPDDVDANVPDAVTKSPVTAEQISKKLGRSTWRNNA